MRCTPPPFVRFPPKPFPKQLVPFPLPTCPLSLQRVHLPHPPPPSRFLPRRPSISLVSSTPCPFFPHGVRLNGAVAADAARDAPPPCGAEADCWSDAPSPAEAHERRKNWWGAQRRRRTSPVLVMRAEPGPVGAVGDAVSSPLPLPLVLPLFQGWGTAEERPRRSSEAEAERPRR